MSQLTLTPQEDQIVLDALRAKGATYTAMFGSMEPSIEALIAKVQSQLPTETLVVKEAPAEETVAEAICLICNSCCCICTKEEVVVEAPKAKKTKAVEETPEEN